MFTIKKLSGATSDSSSSDIPVAVIYSGAGVAVPADFLGMTFFSQPYVYSGTSSLLDATSASSTTDRVSMASSYNGRIDRCYTATFIATSGTLPAPLALDVSYFVRDADSPNATSFALSTTLSGDLIDLTTNGSGTHQIRFTSYDAGVPFGLIRSLNSFPGWGQINTANGVYDWSIIDGQVLYHYALGRRVMYCFHMTPTWAAPNSALDAYGYPGGGQVPTSTAYAATYITALLNRYNAVSAVNPGGDKMIAAVEVWNEPVFAAPGTTSSEWCGTLAQLAEHTRVVATAVKAVDATCQVLGPGFTSGAAFATTAPTGNNAYNWLIASDGAGGYGKDWIDGFAYHAYSIATQERLVSGIASIASMRRMLVNAGLAADFPIYQTERGIDVGPDELPMRLAIVEAALGVKATIHYAYEGYGINFDDTRALNDLAVSFNAIVAGETISYCALMQDGRVTVTTGAGTLTV